MTISSWLSWPLSRSHTRRGRRANPTARPKRARLFVEQLEVRVTLSYGTSTLAFFDGANGREPEAGVIMDSSGNLYGTTYEGGAYGDIDLGDGTVYEIAKGSGTVTTLASLDGANGQNTSATLVMDASGNLYGTATYGGAFGYGTVFELAKGSGTITTLASFNETNGDYPVAGLVMDKGGNLYGTAQWSNGATSGLVFEVKKGSHRITVLATGTGSDSPLIIDSSGNLYGMGGSTGAFGDGSVFELAHGSHTITTLASFNGADGTGGDGP